LHLPGSPEVVLLEYVEPGQQVSSKEVIQVASHFLVNFHTENSLGNHSKSVSICHIPTLFHLSREALESFATSRPVTSTIWSQGKDLKKSC